MTDKAHCQPMPETYLAPEDAQVEWLCSNWGFGAVMASAARLWAVRDPVGALTVGPALGSTEARNPANHPDQVTMEAVVEAAIAAWHDRADTLHDWLGWTWEEYAAWVRDPAAIPRVPKHFALAQPTITEPVESKQ